MKTMDTQRGISDAEVLARARNLSVSGVVQAGILHSVGGKTRLLKRSELEANGIQGWILGFVYGRRPSI